MKRERERQTEKEPWSNGGVVSDIDLERLRDNHNQKENARSNETETGMLNLIYMFETTPVDIVSPVKFHRRGYAGAASADEVDCSNSASRVCSDVDIIT